MAVNLGSSAVSLYLGSQSVNAYLGAVQVGGGPAPGKPTVESAASGGVETTVVLAVPTGTITGYRFYFDGVLATPTSTTPDNGTFTALFDAGYAGQEAEVSALNGATEGEKSDPVTVVAN